VNLIGDNGAYEQVVALSSKMSQSEVSVRYRRFQYVELVQCYFARFSMTGASIILTGDNKSYPFNL
jgi:hypothetical protein